MRMRLRLRNYKVQKCQTVRGSIFDSLFSLLFFCSRAHLDEMINHEFGDAPQPPLGMHEDERDVGLRVTHVGNEKRESNHQLPIERNATEFRVLQVFRNCNEI